MQRVFLHRSVSILLGLLILCVNLGFGSLTHKAHAAPSQITITEFPIPTSGSQPVGITSGPDGNLWFTESNANQIGVITPSGTVIAEYPIPTSGGVPFGITSGPDGNLWFTENNANGNDEIGKITPGGTITEYPIPTSNSVSYDITSGPDGNLWFTETRGKIGKITPGGTITEYSLSAGSEALAITSGPDGNLWFTDIQTQENVNEIGKITTSGTPTEYPLPNGGSPTEDITSGPDGNLWFAEYAGKIGKSTPGGTITEYPIPTPGSEAFGITSGPDGNLWFTENTGNNIGEITPGGTITEYPIPTSNSEPYRITSGPDGNLWFTENNTNQIGVVNLPGCSASAVNSTTHRAGTSSTASCNTPWGVDSHKPITRSFYNTVVQTYSSQTYTAVPGFWGRYIGLNTKNPKNMTLSEEGVIKQLGLAIAPIYADFTVSVQTKAEGVSYAKKAITAAEYLGVGAGTAIFVNIEPNTQPTPQFIQGWFNQFNKSFETTYQGKSYPYQAGTYIPAFYGGVSSGEQPPNFNSAYCGAVNGTTGVKAEPQIGTNSFIWAPYPTTTNRTGQDNEPSFAPNTPPCANRTVIWQYAVQPTGTNGKGIPPNVDTDEFFSSLPLWKL